MSSDDGGLSVPYARLDGEWEVPRTTRDGRPAVAIREDSKSGVAFGYPYAEGRDGNEEVLKVAAVRNVLQGYVLVAASMVSMEAVENLRSIPGNRHRIDRGEYNALEDAEVMRLLDGRTLVLVDAGVDTWYPGAIQLFDDVDAVGETWASEFPRVRERLVAVERVLDGRGLTDVLARGGHRTPSP